MRIMTLVWGILPALLWLLYFYLQDRFPEPPKVVFRVFVFGALAIIPAVIIEMRYVTELWQGAPILSSILVNYGVVATAEELSKLASMVISLEKAKVIDSPVDGLVYGVSAGLGFATLENILYINSFGMQVAPVRAIFSNLAHALFTGVLGYHYARSILLDKKSEIWKGILWAVFLHGSYNFILISGVVSPIWAIVLLAVAFYKVSQVFRRQRRVN
ncbi:MAG: PrsW family intramembrane metalloprotease [Firmicutes bacterium]|nr:PrsW family intramembrane metalloprotease [Bacillota bacterium]